jgi:hypothetical protein
MTSKFEAINALEALLLLAIKHVQLWLAILENRILKRANRRLTAERDRLRALL